MLFKMVKYIQEQRTNMAATYLSSNGSIVALQRDFKWNFNIRSSPSRDCIISIVKRFHEFGTVSDKNALEDQCQDDLKLHS